MGIIAKRSIANAAWNSGEEPGTYAHPYWLRLKKLQYDFINRNPVSTALRFTLAQEGVCTAIVGTTNPTRYHENLAWLSSGPLSVEMVKKIRDRWDVCREDDWLGQT